MRAISLASSAASLNLLRRPQHFNRHLPAVLQRRQQWQHLSRVPSIGSKPQILLNHRLIAMAYGGNAEKVEVPASVPVRVAHELLQAGHHYLDVRTPEEFSAGHPVGAVNVPYMFKAGDGMKKNPAFLEEVSKRFGKDAEIIVGCQSGKRSLMAATDLSLAGFTGVTDIAGGYSAWRQIGLPTE